MRLNDVRFALRLARRQRLLSVVATLVLAVGIALTTAVFALVNAVWFRPLPFPEADRLVAVSESHPQRGHARLVSPATYDRWRRQASEGELGAFSEQSFALSTADGQADQVRGVRVAPALLRLLGARPLAGRSLERQDDPDGAPPVAIISERLWRRQFDANPDVVGRVVRLDGVDTTIVGVLPYTFKVVNSAFDLFRPLASSSLSNDADRTCFVIARLRSGERADALLARLRSVAATSATRADAAEWTPVVRGLDQVVWGDARPAYLLLLVAAGLLLALITANVSNLLVARSETRREEFAVRLALGAGRRRLFGQLLAEGLLLSLTAGALALLLCLWMHRLLLANVPEMTDLVLDLRVFAFALSIAGAIGIAFGVLPAWTVARGDGLSGLRDAASIVAPRRGSGRRLAAAQVAAATALIIACGLLVRAAVGIRHIDPGFEVAPLLTASLSLPDAIYPDAAGRLAFYREVVRRVREAPGVEAVGLTTLLPLEEGVSTAKVELEGHAVRKEAVLHLGRKTVDAGYASTLRLRVLAGRWPHDQITGVGLVNAALPKALGLGHEQVVGSRIRVDGGPWTTIAGVVSDARQVLTEPVYPEVWLPLTESAPARVSLLLRARQGQALALAPGLRALVREVSPDVPVSNVYPMSAIVDGYLPAPFIVAFGILSVVALFFGGLGLYAVVAFQVTRRAREFGLRMALGADARRILAIIVGDALRLTGVGIVIGAVMGVGMGRFLSARFLDVRLADPLLLIGVPVLLSAVTLLASLLPGRRAVRASPAVVLRQL